MNGGTRRVLLAEDDPELGSLLTRLLTGEGYRVDLVADGQAGMHRALVDRYDVLIIDRGLPGLDGLDLIRRIRARGVRTPTLVLTAYGSVADRVSGLDSGAEDYLVKPFDVDELLARLRALIRRAETADTIRLGDGTIRLAERRALGPDGAEVELSMRECALLGVLVSRPGRVFSRDELLSRAFPTADSATIVDTYVHYLRRKLGRAIVHTVRGYGYRIGSM